MIYKPSMTVIKSAEPPVVMGVLGAILIYGGKLIGVDIEKEEAAVTVPVLYGLWRGLRNFIKNRKK